MHTIRIATRKSPLARLMAEMVGNAIRRVHNCEVEYLPCDAQGDHEPNRPLASVTERGYFTRLVTRSVLDGRADIAVHSWKDVPTEYEEGAEIFGTLVRADMRDLMLFRGAVVEEAKKSGTRALNILSSSPRRSRNLAGFLGQALPFSVPDVKFLPIRGNIETRLRKLLAGEGDALVVAKAAIDRLLGSKDPALSELRSFMRTAFEKLKFIVVPLSVSPPAAAQGAIAIEGRRGDKKIADLIRAISCHDSFESVQQEREILAGLGGGCEQAIGAAILPRSYGSVHYIKGLSSAGQVFDTAKITRAHPLPKARTKEAIHVSRRDDGSIRREQDSFSSSQVGPDTFIFCAKQSAWPQGFDTPKRSVVWTAGLKTWEALAKRGVWVNGSSESLGEQEDPKLNEICPQLERRVKLTHREAAQREDGSGFEKIGTYHLDEKALKGEDFAPYSHFYWRSSDEFSRALKVFPELSKRFHGCGPGRSLATIAQALSGPGKVAPYLSAEEFLGEVQP